MPKPQPFLSKSKYLNGVKCSKLLWCDFNKREAFGETDPATQAIFDQGTLVGELARKLYPEGILIGRENMPELTHAKSIEALKLRKPLFEAGLIYGRTYALPDILVPVENNAWDIIEVKSGTDVEEQHLIDTAFQKYVYSGAGLKVRHCYLMHINTEYLRKGPVEPKKLFTKVDITEKIKPYRQGLEKSIEETLAIMAGQEPKVKIGPHCGDPYPCPLEGLCWEFLPKGDIFQLYRGRKERLFALLDQGILKLTDIPLDDLNDKQLIQVKSHRSGKAHIDKEGIGDFLDELKYPLYLLDFETINPAVPVYDLTHPYEWIPFQFSLHVIEKEGGKPVHHPYLAPGDVDPRPEILRLLKSLLGSSGTVLAWNMHFEINCLKKSAKAYPDYISWVSRLEKRFIDLIVPFRGFSYYHPAQEGSASLKYVLPALTDSSYKGMEIADGGTASREYARVTFGENFDPKDLQKVRTALEKYCQLDTQAMIDILASLRNRGI
ncbi:hypothetical protein A2625_03950 [candidate division WOR-1 bacterium RIFCSPHIGHO2_01_FULL_53_15]|uniref:DUF2779 domain-containing protein n=1 Tax=candidate division WOR-1 bacterium RIFCSPHIGHO2_01_FULL_53_15 TaxID=1802564 RepID=A0A1F4Q046_UNCSA|nr:MAG: hypothetical protein A2625_03950 [candidate division WOR-1 bacterium RIFCSPHIGHO2_01_FULL_53_15]OGC12923.1 MAG: hypothetical protein A3D23_04985 [candidate division WOR-1 bacterium RIFCSPHIGHO2_02_FULL_53_26]